MQTVKDSQKIVKNKAYCDDVIMGKAIPTEIADPEVKKEILNDPFNNYFLVDLYADKIDGNVKLYRVVTLHNIIPKEDEE